MTDVSDTITERTRENFETVYRVYHAARYGFGGHTSICVAVEDETPDRIEGRRYDPMMDWPGEQVVINKNTVAGWEEIKSRHREIPTGAEAND